MGERPFWKRQHHAAAPAGLPIDLTKLRERELPVFTRALHPHPSARWPSCLAFVAALREASKESRRVKALASSGTVKKASRGRQSRPAQPPVTT
jgi:hypothetical protein